MVPAVVSCRLLYSTQSGRARSCCRRVSRILGEGGLDVTNKPGSSWDTDVFIKAGSDPTGSDPHGAAAALVQWAQNLRAHSTVLILFVSTTGDGEHTDTIRHTWSALLQKSLPANLLEGVPFAVFNLGDRAYGPQFCAAGRKLTVRLLQLGATLLGEPGYGDDGTAGGGVFADLDVWLAATLRPALASRGLVLVEDPKNQHQEQESSFHVGHTLLALKQQQQQQDAVRPYSVQVTPKESSSSSSSFLPPSTLEPKVVNDPSFASFWEHARPSNAYSYSVSRTDRQLVRNASTSQLEDALSSPTTRLVATLQENTRLTASDWTQDTRHLRLRIHEISGHPFVSPTTTNKNNHNESLPYCAGDVVSILPRNSSPTVDRFLSVLPSLLQQLADSEITIKYVRHVEPLVCYPHWPTVCTLRTWLTHCADIHALPEREDLWALSHFCCPQHPRGPEQRAKLQSLSEASSSALYNDYVLRQKRTWADVLYDFDSIRAPESDLSIESLLALLSPIRPREFSIASSARYQQCCRDKIQPPSVSNQDSGSGTGFVELELCVAVVAGTTPLGRSYRGFCSGFLADLHPDHHDQEAPHVVCWIRPGSFLQMPVNLAPPSNSESPVATKLATPVLYIGAGTGIAPLRSMIQERYSYLYDQQRHDHDNNLQETTAVTKATQWFSSDILVFGCRKKTADFYYEQEWASLQEEPGHFSLLTAFSQDQRHKVYVQKVLRLSDPTGEHLVDHLVTQSGCLYIAGGAKMARSVKDEIMELLALGLGGSEKDAKLLLTKLQRKGRFRVEAWN